MLPPLSVSVSSCACPARKAHGISRVFRSKTPWFPGIRDSDGLAGAIYTGFRGTGNRLVRINTGFHVTSHVSMPGLCRAHCHSPPPPQTFQIEASRPRLASTARGDKVPSFFQITSVLVSHSGLCSDEISAPELWRSVWPQRPSATNPRCSNGGLPCAADLDPRCRGTPGWAGIRGR